MSAILKFIRRNAWLIIVPNALLLLAYTNFFVLNDQDFTPMVLIMPVVIGLILGGLLQTISAQKQALDSLNTNLLQSNAALYEQQSETLNAIVRTQNLQGSAMMAIGAVHDMRNILAPIVMGGQFIEVSNPDDKILLNDMSKSAERGVELTNKILNALNHSSHSPTVNSAETLIPSVWKRTQSILPETIGVTFNIQRGQIYIDSDDFMQIVHNICVNALKAIGEGTEMTITAKKVEDGYNIQIGDNGDGIPMDVIQNMKNFKPRLTDGQVHGLGLPIIAHIVERNDGQIEISSDASGTTISMTFPQGPAVFDEGSQSPIL